MELTIVLVLLLLLLVGLAGGPLLALWRLKRTSQPGRAGQDNEKQDLFEKAGQQPASSRHRADEYRALCKRYGLPLGATDKEISAAIDRAFEAGRRRSRGLPVDAPESEVRKLVAASYGLAETCSDAELSAAVNKAFEAGRRRSRGLPADAPESELRKLIAASYGLPETCSDAELSAAVNKKFEDGYRRGLGLPPV